jgi:hypothetical protein
MELLEVSRCAELMNLFEKTITLYKELRSLIESIIESKCFNLLSYIAELIIIYHEKLKNLLVE